MSGFRVISIDDPPMSLDYAKAHLRVLHSDDDDQITGLIGSGFDHVERITGRLFRNATCELTLRTFPAGPIALPRSPVRSLTSLAYTDSTGTDQAITDCLVDTNAIPGTVEPAVGKSWPATQDRPGAVTLTFEAGLAAFPKSVTQAVLIYLDLEYHEHETATAKRMEQRIVALVKGLTIRSRDLVGLRD